MQNNVNSPVAAEIIANAPAQAQAKADAKAQAVADKAERAAKPAAERKPTIKRGKASDKPAKRKPAAKPATAPKADASAERLALAKRIATERKTAASIFAQAKTASVSIPVKALSAFGRTYKRDVTAHSIGRKPSPRQAAALAVAAAASGITIADGAKIPRKFTMRGADYAIENGALSDAIASGLCTYHAASETITLRNAAELRSQCGSKAITI